MGVRDFLARHITRRVNVYRVDDFSIEPPEVHKNMKRVETFSMRPSIPAEVSRPFDFGEFTENVKRPAVNVKFSGKGIKAKNIRVKRYVKEDIKTHKYQLMRKPKTWTMLKQVQALPQERANILRYMKKKPELSGGGVILACYGPVVEGAVLKLALNKQRGTLLVWYKPGSRQLKARNVYLVRRLGLGEKPEWRWE